MNLPEFTQRQVLVWGKEKVMTLRNAHVVIAGVGGLGAVVAEQLARSGVAALSLIDSGVVDAPDLGRQVLYSRTDIGRSKVLAAAERLQTILPELHITTYKHQISSCKPLPDGLQMGQDCLTVYADCLDNYASRFAYESLLPAGAVLVHAGIESEHGQITAIRIGTGSQLRDIFSPKAKTVASIPITPQTCAVVGGFQSLILIHNIWRLAGISAGSTENDTECLLGCMRLIDIHTLESSVIPLLPNT